MFSRDRNALEGRCSRYLLAFCQNEEEPRQADDDDYEPKSPYAPGVNLCYDDQHRIDQAMVEQAYWLCTVVAKMLGLTAEQLLMQ